MLHDQFVIQPEQKLGISRGDGGRSARAFSKYIQKQNRRKLLIIFFVLGRSLLRCFSEVTNSFVFFFFQFISRINFTETEGIKKLEFRKSREAFSA